MTENAHTIPEFWLAAYYDGELDGSQRLQVEAHLPECPSCRSKLDELRWLGSALAVDRPAGEALDWPAFWNRLEPQLPERTQVARTLISWLPGIGLLFLNGLVQVGAAVTFAALFIAGQARWATRDVSWLRGLTNGFPVGWLSQWGSWGVILLFVNLMFGVAVLYLAWLGYTWRYRWHSAARPIM